MMKITIKRILGIIGMLMAIGFGVFVYGGWQMFGCIGYYNHSECNIV